MLLYYSKIYVLYKLYKDQTNKLANKFFCYFKWPVQAATENALKIVIISLLIGII